MLFHSDLGNVFESYFWMFCAMVERRDWRHRQGGKEEENVEDGRRLTKQLV